MHHTPLAQMRTALAPWVLVVAGMVVTVAGAADGDPPGRVAHVNLLEGSGALQTAGTDGWSADMLNRPLTGGDRIWIDERSRAEMHIGSTALRLGARTAVQILAVDDHHVQLAMTAGSLSVRIHNLEAQDRFDIQTPAGDIALVQPGGYRLDVDDQDSRAYLAVWSGRAEVSGPSSTSRVRDNESAELIAGSEPAIETATAGNTDNLDLWAEERDRREDQSSAADYVSREVVGYQDLDGYGEWVSEPSYGMVWVPVVVAGWAPYRYGYWNWISPWGWTWIAREPWGFAPCHYGRWVHARHGWAWAPGERDGYPPVYAPALVAWRGDRYPRHDSGPARTQVGWIPLGFNEIYDPPFHASRDYLRASNLSNTHVGRRELERFIDDRQRVGARDPERRYANDMVPGAYSAAPREAFTSAFVNGPKPVSTEPNRPPQATVRPYAQGRVVSTDRPVTRAMVSAPVERTDGAGVADGARAPVGLTLAQRPDRPVTRPSAELSAVVVRTTPTPRAAAPAYRESPPVARPAESHPGSTLVPASGAAPTAAVMAGGRTEHHAPVHMDRPQP